LRVESSSGGSRTHSILATNLRSVPEPGWSANCLPSLLFHPCPAQDSNLQTSGSRPDRSADWSLWHATPASSFSRDEPRLGAKVRPRHAPKDLNPDQLGWSQSCCQLHQGHTLNFSGSRGTRTHNGSAAACFQNRFLIQPDDFRLQAAGVGIEPTASWFRARRHYQQRLSRIVC
jgi:hypothetical protein